MTDRAVLQVQPAAMHVVSQAVSSAAKDLRTQLVELDSQVRELLNGWQGESGSAYAAVWDSWHRGAGEVQSGLAILYRAIGTTATEFEANENASAQILDRVHHG